LQVPPWDNRWLLAAISTSMLLHFFILCGQGLPAFLLPLCACLERGRVAAASMQGSPHL
jgi:hypothetical protein